MDDKSRNLRALKWLALAAIFVVGIMAVDPLYESWETNSSKVEQLEKKAAKLREIDTSEATNKKLLTGFIMPVDRETQLSLFSQSIEKCFKKCNIEWNRDPAYDSLRGKKESSTGLTIYNLKIGAVTSFANTLNLLEELKSNPYLYAIEEFSLKREGNDQQRAKLELTLSTLAK